MPPISVETMTVTMSYHWWCHRNTEYLLLLSLPGKFLHEIQSCCLTILSLAVTQYRPYRSRKKELNVKKWFSHVILSSIYCSLERNKKSSVCCCSQFYYQILWCNVWVFYLSSKRYMIFLPTIQIYFLTISIIYSNANSIKVILLIYWIWYISLSPQNKNFISVS